MAATYQVAPPEPFNFSRPQEWPKWIRRFERFRSAAGLAEKEDEVQANTLVYTMGDQADDIMRSFDLSESDRRKYAKVKDSFESHFVKKRNIIFERAKFNMRKQEPGEPVDDFINDLYALAEHCQYGGLHDDLIRDRLVVGLRDTTLSEKLQLDAELTLEKVVTRVRQAEAVRQQQSVVRADSGVMSDPLVGRLYGKDPGPPKGRRRESALMEGKRHTAEDAVCQRCGKPPHHDCQRCPVRGAVCRGCGKQGHFQRMCRSARIGGLELEESTDRDTFLGAVGCNDITESNRWSVKVELNGYPIDFQIDTGAEVTVISESIHKSILNAHLLPADRTLRGPSQKALSVKGCFHGTVKSSNREVEQLIYVVQGLHRPLLGTPAIKGLGLLERVGAIEQDKRTPEQRFPHLFAV